LAIVGCGVQRITHGAEQLQTGVGGHIHWIHRGQAAFAGYHQLAGGMRGLAAGQQSDGW
jgi:hypothetical protein